MRQKDSERLWFTTAATEFDSINHSSGGPIRKLLVEEAEIIP
jgi:hypothetical protein